MALPVNAAREAAERTPAKVQPQQLRGRTAMKTPHKHADLIHAWADGAEIEVRNDLCEESWEVTTLPLWRDYFEYRIKPEPEPDVVGFYYADKRGYVCGSTISAGSPSEGNLKLTFDGETGKLKSAEVI